jgi:hypothetical protein
VQTRIERKEESETKTVAEGEKETSPNQSTNRPQLCLHLQPTGVAAQVSLSSSLPQLYSLIYPLHYNSRYCSCEL